MSNIKLLTFSFRKTLNNFYIGFQLNRYSFVLYILTFATSKCFQIDRLSRGRTNNNKKTNSLTFFKAAVRSPFHFAEFSSEVKSYVVSLQRPVFIFIRDKTQRTFLPGTTSKRHCYPIKRNTKINEENFVVHYIYGTLSKFCTPNSHLFNKKLHFLKQAYKIVSVDTRHVVFCRIFHCNLFIVFRICLSLFPWAQRKWCANWTLIRLHFAYSITYSLILFHSLYF